MQRLLRPLVFCVVVPLVAVAPLHAQAPGFVGTVQDPRGRPVEGIRVELTGPLGVACATSSGPDGRVRCDGLADGTYTLLVTADGFRASPIRVSVAHGTAAPVSIPLAVAALSESVVVTAAAVDTPRSAVAASTGGRASTPSA